MNKLKLPLEVKKTIDKLEKAGFETWVVGGPVRDLLMNRPTKNWDFTTKATPEQILGVFPDGFYDNRFGTIGISQKQKLPQTRHAEFISASKIPKQVRDDAKYISFEEKKEVFEITTYRTEQDYSDKRHPDKVKWGKSLEKDLSRRDFTINAIAFNGKELVDPYDGQKDLKKKIIKAVGDPNKRFSEDALRLLRAVRIATQLGFVIEEKTFLAIKKNVNLIKKISSERIRDELLKILSSDFPADGFYLLKNSGLLAEILPELEVCFKIPQQSPKRHHLHDVGTHCFLSLKYCPSKDPIVRLATLLHDLGKPIVFRKDKESIITFYNHEVVGASMVKKISQRLRLSKKDQDKLYTLIRWHQFSVDERQTNAAIRRFIKRVGKNNLDDILAVRTGDRLGGGARETSWRLERFKKLLVEVQKQPFSVADLKVSGHDVMKILKIKPGPKVGQILEALFKEVEEDKDKNKREYLLKKIKIL
ncbi:CCA tRNA nucleotidyltransferase [Candidatus Microgenomates bacterium]|nr:CCA tRNA nucleotidyltransferase [Candidatus Microgenomates bacterium]